jgi:hypothetical protein
LADFVDADEACTGVLLHLDSPTTVKEALQDRTLVHNARMDQYVQFGFCVKKVASREMSHCDLTETLPYIHSERGPGELKNQHFTSLCKAFPDREENVYCKTFGDQKMRIFCFPLLLHNPFYHAWMHSFHMYNGEKTW